jgi:hypothetical protein
MTVETEYAPLMYAGNVVANNFPVTWPFFSGTLVVRLIEADDSETILSEGSDFTVDGGTDEEGKPAVGELILSTELTAGQSLRIERSTPLTQGSTWPENDPFPQATIEAALDKNVLMLQEVLAGELSIGTVETVEAGEPASATITGVPPRLNLAIPRGEQGLTGSPGAPGDGNGDVIGPEGATDGHAVLFDGNTGKILKSAGAAPALDGHGHTISDVTGLQDALDLKAAAAVQVNGGGLVTGGGTLTENRTLTVTAATPGDFRTGTEAGEVLTPKNVWDSAGFVTLTQAATIAVDFSTGFNFTTTMTGNRTLGSPSNAKPGQSGTIYIIQDGSGGRTLAYGSNWKFAGGAAPSLTTTANRIDALHYVVRESNWIEASLVKDIR